MVFSDTYVFAITKEEIKTKWPNMAEGVNFKFTSEQTWDYNCVAYVLGIKDDWIDFYYTADGSVSMDLGINSYIDLFKNHGFSICKNDSLQKGFEKIAIFEDSNKWFSHVSLQLSDGKWTSKMGEYEDIKHTDLESVSNGIYGTSVVFMKREITI